MSRIFLSHSSRNNAHAIALRDWLVDAGWDDLFLDLDPERGITAGERWERALNEAATRCEAVLFLVSRDWLNSGWCLKEFRLAGKLNKRMFGLLIDGLAIADLPPEIAKDWQLVDLASGTDHRTFRVTMPNGDAEEHVTFSQSGLARLKAGLTRAGLDAKFFAWPPEHAVDRAPYPGLKALEADDAGIFFGREAPTIAVLDRLRGLREAAVPRFFAILGASGAGKSSFLRAGLLPRLARDDRNFVPLPVIRPERAALSAQTGLVACLTSAFTSAKLGITRAQVLGAIADGAGGVLPMLAQLAEAKRVPAMPGESATLAPTLVLPIDQGEELFLAEGTAEAQAFLSFLRDIATTTTPNLIILFAIRSDSYERLQSAPELEGITQDTFSLPPMPRGAFESVIEGPARRLASTKRPLKIEPALTQALLSEIETGGAKDALPLLAFTLERLYVDHGGDGDLTLDEYRQTGGVKGSIEAAVERALVLANADSRVPKDRATRLALLRTALIPWLAGIDTETGAPRRRVARLTEIPEEARPQVEHLVTVRLLATDVSPEGVVTIEPAHEALLRQWGLLQGWLDEDFAALSSLDGVKRAARDWEANARDAGWLAHVAGRLEDAERFGAEAHLRNYLDKSDFAYLAACRAAETGRRDRELEDARRREADAERIAEQQRKIAVEQTARAESEQRAKVRTRIGLGAVIALLIGAFVAIFVILDKEQQALNAQQSSLETVRDITRQLSQSIQLGTPASYVFSVKSRSTVDSEFAIQSSMILERNLDSLRRAGLLDKNPLPWLEYFNAFALISSQINNNSETTKKALDQLKEIAKRAKDLDKNSSSKFNLYIFKAEILLGARAVAASKMDDAEIYLQSARKLYSILKLNEDDSDIFDALIYEVEGDKLRVSSKFLLANSSYEQSLKKYQNFLDRALKRNELQEESKKLTKSDLIKRKTAILNGKISDMVYEITKDPNQALIKSNKNVEISKELLIRIKFEPDFFRGFGIAQERNAYLNRKAMFFEKAIDGYQSSRNVFENLINNFDRINLNNRLSYVFNSIGLSDSYYDRYIYLSKDADDLEKANKAIIDASVTIKKILEEEDSNREKYYLAQTYFKMARIQKELGIRSDINFRSIIELCLKTEYKPPGYQVRSPEPSEPHKACKDLSLPN
jgi:TIR domain